MNLWTLDFIILFLFIKPIFILDDFLCSCFACNFYSPPICKFNSCKGFQNYKPYDSASIYMNNLHL